MTVIDKKTKRKMVVKALVRLAIAIAAALPFVVLSACHSTLEDGAQQGVIIGGCPEGFSCKPANSAAVVTR